MRISKRYMWIIWVVLTISVLSMVYMLIFCPEAIVILKITCITCVVLSALVLILYYKAKAIYNYIKTRYKDVYKYIVECLVRTFATWTDRLKAKMSKKSELDLLTPTIENSEYVNQLRDAIDNQKVCNIAITGSYGAGKSTVIKTFQYLYPKYKCLNLSLAAFAEDQTTAEGKDAPKPDSGFKQQTEHIAKSFVDSEKLEYSLLQQFFYHVKASEIPDSRYGRIRRISRTTKFIWACASFVYIVAIYYLINPKIFTLIKDRNIDDSTLNLYVGSVISMLTIVFLYNIVGLFHRLNTARLKVMDYEVSLEKTANISIFNRYIDELVYLFTRTKYKVVVLEDLDRFENTSIFTKLRELNLLLNQSKDIRRRIVFVYALRDSVFANTKERTKFFDYIIPITPHVNAYSSASHFIDKLNKYVGEDSDEKALHKNFISDIASYIPDYRTIKTIVSDFKLTKEQLKGDLKQDNLLAMIVYKNAYPQEFEKIHDCQGNIVEVFKKKKELISAEVAKVEDEISDKVNEIRLIETELLHSVNELKSVVVSAFIKELPAGAYPCHNNRNQIKYSDLYTDENIKEILTGQMCYLSSRTYNPTTVEKANVTINLGESFDYAKRKANLEAKTANKTNVLESERKKLLIELSELNKATLCEMLSFDPSAIDGVLVGDDAEMLKLLLKRGYIDEQYHYYVTIFKAGLLSDSDNNYLMSIKSIGDSGDDDFMTSITDPKTLLSLVVNQDFRSDKILNFDIVRAIMSGQFNEFKQQIFERLSKGDYLALDFCLRYPYPEDGLVEGVCKSHPNIWIEFQLDSSFSNESRLEFCTRILKYATIDSIKAINADRQLTEYIETSYLFDVPGELSLTKSIAVLDAIEPSFTNLLQSQNNDKLLEHIYQHSYYELNEINVRLLLQKFGNSRVVKQSGHIYTDIRSSEASVLQSNVEENIISFTSEIILSKDNTKESAESVVSLLNNDKLSEGLKQKFIAHNETKVESIEQIKDDGLKTYMYECNHVVASLENVLYFMRYMKLTSPDDKLIAFMNLNVSEFKNSIAEAEELDEEEISQVTTLMHAENLDLQVGYAILDNSDLKGAWVKIVSDLKEKYVDYIIRNRKIEFEVESFRTLLQKFAALKEVLIRSYKSEFLDSLAEFNFTGETLVKLARLNCLKDDYNALYSSISDSKVDTEEVADSYLDYVASPGTVYTAGVYFKALQVSQNANKKMASAVAYINSGFSHPNGYSAFFKYFGSPFEPLVQTECNFEIEHNSGSEEFCNLLNRKHILGKVNIKDGKIVSYVKKRDN